jgi:hypothetical protein
MLALTRGPERHGNCIVNPKLLIPSILLVTLVCVGCGENTSTTTPATDVTAKTSKVEPWSVVVAALRDHNDAKTCRKALADLNAELGANPSVEQPRRLVPADVADVVAAFRLSKPEQDDLVQPEYTPLDAAYLSEVLFLASAIQATGLKPGDEPLVKADILFRWVCRNILIAPKVLPTGPPSSLLLRGSGRGLDRAKVFVAACQAIGVEAYFVGLAATDRPSNYSTEPKPDVVPKGPFWAVAVRDGSSYYLYDPWRGEALPGPTADRPATLAEVKAKPDAQPWSSDKANPWDVSSNELRSAELYFSVPFSGLAPRLVLLQEKLERDHGVKLYFDWRSISQSSPGGPPIQPWNPPTDPFSPVRMLKSFLPVSQGGTAAELNGNSELGTQFLLSRIPLRMFGSLPRDLPRAVADLLSQQALQIYDQSFLSQPSTREQLLRGELMEATKALVQRQDRFELAEIRRKSSSAMQATQMKVWLEAVAIASDNLRVANLPENAAKLPEAKARQNQLFKELPQQYYSQLLDEVLAPVGLSEIGVQLATISHERAEAAEVNSIRATRAAAAAPADQLKQDAANRAKVASKKEWKAAIDAWARLNDLIPTLDDSMPGRTAQVQNLRKRAETLAAKP